MARRAYTYEQLLEAAVAKGKTAAQFARTLSNMLEAEWMKQVISFADGTVRYQMTDLGATALAASRQPRG